MAVDGGLGARRQPQFLDGGAPDLAVDSNAVADYAASFGNRVVDTAAARSTATSWAWAGLEWRDTDDGAEWVFDGSGWILLSPLLADVSTFGSNWSATNTTSHKPRLRRIGQQVFLFGAVTIAAGASSTNILTVGTDFRPPTTTSRFVGATISSNGQYGELSLSSGVLGIAAGYGNISLPAGAVLPIVSSWWLD